MSKNEILNIINTFSVKERLELIESILIKLRKESNLSSIDLPKGSSGNDLLMFAGIWDKETAESFDKSTKECRKIDLNQW